MIKSLNSNERNSLRRFSGLFFPSVCGLLLFLSAPVAAVDKIDFLYFSHVEERPPALSNLDIPPADLGEAGGLLGVADNNTTGVFMNQEFSLNTVKLKPEQNPMAEYQKIVGKQKYRFVVTNVSAETLLKIADLPASKDVIFFNAGAKDNGLRTKDCRENIFHVTPSRQMLADALAQYLMTKRWNDWMLVTGRRPGDKAFAESVRVSAKKFGADISLEKAWEFGPDTRRTAQAQIPVFTQDFDGDVIVVADEVGEFGEYLAYRTWSPNPIVGTQGLTPRSWHKTQEQWGAAQLQSRFLKKYKRKMRDHDYSVWQGIRSVGEAATRTQSTDFTKIKKYLIADSFTLAGFKGIKLTFRKWNHQLRQPVLLTTDTALVSKSPQEKYLHKFSQLDTLGVDKPNSKCSLN